MHFFQLGNPQTASPSCSQRLANGNQHSQTVFEFHFFYLYISCLLISFPFSQVIKSTVFPL